MFCLQHKTAVYCMQSWNAITLPCNFTPLGLPTLIALHVHWSLADEPGFRRELVIGGHDQQLVTDAAVERAIRFRIAGDVGPNRSAHDDPWLGHGRSVPPSAPRRLGPRARRASIA